VTAAGVSYRTAPSGRARRGAPKGPSVSASYASTLIDFAVSRGADPAALLARAGIDAGALACPDNRLPFADLKSLMRAAADACADPAFALHFGESPILYDTTIVGLIIRSSETMGEALREFRRYARLVMEVDAEDSPDRFSITLDGADCWFEDRRPQANDFPEATDATFARLVCDTSRMFPDRPSFFKAAFVTHSAPAWRDEYERVLKTPVTFESDRNALRIDAAWLTTKMPTANRYSRGIFSSYADRLLQALDGSRTTRGEVERLLAATLHKGDVRLRTIAGKLGVSAPTLYRMLKAEGASYETVLDSLRRRIAVEHLSRRRSSVNETAFLLGYSDPASFSRAFKRWTGANPRDFKREAPTGENADA
jgi:AraC-like DNA-binding protein